MLFELYNTHYINSVRDVALNVYRRYVRHHTSKPVFVQQVTLLDAYKEGPTGHHILRSHKETHYCRMCFRAFTSAQLFLHSHGYSTAFVSMIVALYYGDLAGESTGTESKCSAVIPFHAVHAEHYSLTTQAGC